MVLAAPPNTPLPLPDFSFDHLSPTVESGLVDSHDVLTVDLDQPAASIPGAALGMFSPFDDLDGLSASNWSVPMDVPFALLFSVDRATQGVPGIDPMMVILGVPFTAGTQAVRNQAAGDEFMAAQLYTRGGTVRRSDRPATSVLTRNNFDEGGTDFGAQPPTNAYQGNFRVPQDSVDALALLERAGSERAAIINVYFSLTTGSPSLPYFPGGDLPSGAHIFFNPYPGMAPTSLYASFYSLGLLQSDDIDGLIVFDINQNRWFDGLDMVLFSLSPGSPSLTLINGASALGAAADVFVVRYGQAPQVFASAAELGLGHPNDNIDALDYFYCSDPYACAGEHGIRALKGDMNCDNLVGFADINAFVLAITNPAAYEQTYPLCFSMNGDVNRNGIFGFDDINPFVALLTGAGGH